MPTARTRRHACLAVAGLLVALTGCETSFDPRGSFEKRLVLYGILTPQTDTVSVRLQATYDPPGMDPLAHVTEPDLSGGTATLQWGASTVVLRDTVVAHPDADRYRNGLRLLTAAPLRVARGTTYTIRVERPGYPAAEVRTTVPNASQYYLHNEDVLRNPTSASADELDLVVGVSPETHGFWPRLMIEYEILSEGGRIEQREVPSALIATSVTVTPVYPNLRGISASRGSTNPWYETFHFEAEAYRYLLGELAQRYGPSQLRFRRAILTISLVDRHLYTYYYIVNGFFDPYTVRTDHPDYSNVTGGVGIVGASSVDSLIVTLPPTLLGGG